MAAPSATQKSESVLCSASGVAQERVGSRGFNGPPCSRLSRVYLVTRLLAAALTSCLCIGSLPAFVFAQNDANDPRRNAPIRFGGLHITPSVALTDLGVDTNVFNQDGELQAADFTFTVRPELDFWLPVATFGMLEIVAIPSATYYKEFASERSFNPQVDARAEIYLNRITLFGEGSYLDTRSRQNFEIDLRARQIQDVVSAGAEVRLFRKIRLESSVYRQRFRFDGDQFYLGTSLQETLDRDSNSGRATVKWDWTPLTTLVLRGDVTSDRFDFLPDRDTDSVRVTIGGEFEQRAVISGEAHVGIRRFEPLNVPEVRFQGVVADVELRYRFRGETQFTFAALRDVDYSFEATDPYVLRSTYGLNVQRLLGRRLDLTIGTARHKYGWLDSVAIPGQSPASQTNPRIDVTWVSNASLTYRLRPDMNVGFGVTYWGRRSSTEPSRDFSGLRAGLIISYE